jgi:alpha 1,2-mannosyltransferase
MISVSQAWADFRNRDVQLPGSLDRLRAPDLAQTLKSRPLRAIALVATCLLTIFLFFAAIGGPGHVSLKNAIGYTGVTSGNAKDWLPTWSEASRFKHSPLVDSEEDEKGLKDPYFTKDAETGLEYPPDIRPASLNKYKRAKATFVSLVRNGELGSMRDSMRQVEAVFNRKAGYPWVFLNDEEFSAEFKAGVRQMTRSEIYFGVIPKEHWSYPDYIDQTKAASERQRMEDDHVMLVACERLQDLMFPLNNQQIRRVRIVQAHVQVS